MFHTEMDIPIGSTVRLGVGALGAVICLVGALHMNGEIALQNHVSEIAGAQALADSRSQLYSETQVKAHITPVSEQYAANAVVADDAAAQAATEAAANDVETQRWFWGGLAASIIVAIGGIDTRRRLRITRRSVAPAGDTPLEHANPTRTHRGAPQGLLLERPDDIATRESRDTAGVEHPR